MSTDELRKKLIERVKRSRRPELLLEAYRLLGTDTEEIEKFKTTAEQRRSIERGLQDVRTKKVITGKDADKEVDEWLSE